MKPWDGEIEAATVDQIRQGADGRIHVIDADGGGVVAGLKRIDKNLQLRYSEVGQYYVVYYRDPDKKTQELVSTYQQLDMRIVEDVARINWENRQPGYSFADELDKADRAAEKEFNYRQREAIGESAERLAHALRKDTNRTDHRAFIPRDIEG